MDKLKFFENLCCTPLAVEVITNGKISFKQYNPAVGLAQFSVEIRTPL